jgi:hypothetical protein
MHESTKTAKRRRLERWNTAKLVLFTVRHLAGVALFVWLTGEARRIDDGNWWLVLGAATVAYAAVAVVMGLRLYRLYAKTGQPRR